MQRFLQKAFATTVMFSLLVLPTTVSATSIHSVSIKSKSEQVKALTSTEICNAPVSTIHSETNIVKKIHNNLFKRKVETEENYQAVQKGAWVVVYKNGQRIYHTKGTKQIGKLQDLFILHNGAGPNFEDALIAVKNPLVKDEYKVFSDLWEKFDDGTYDQNNVDAYDSGVIKLAPQNKIRSKTGHHYACQVGNKVEVYSLNNYDDMNSGFHMSYSVEGTLRGLIIHNCCPYAVVQKANGQLAVFGFEHRAPNPEVPVFDEITVIDNIK
ncbi:hypothetical protein [Risungbinella massiliensis]|uniref:hypothetical protein n=1 Tax=Risungbinella massiliensis TaxID=1329796 RepID=UPI0005CC15FE|nr:hypothetical protein [Risungbinella massiliensis]